MKRFSHFPNFQFRFPLPFAFALILLAALIFFELFNFSTTEFALSDLLGDLSFLSFRWATILSIAFCAIDFAGIARLFSPDAHSSSPFNATWYLFSAWLLAATMNAMLTWWGVSIAILNHQSLGSLIVPRETLVRFVPIFVAILVWVIRVLIIGTFSAAGSQLFSPASPPASLRVQKHPSSRVTSPTFAAKSSKAPTASSFVSKPKPKPKPSRSPAVPPAEPTYHPLAMGPSSDNPSYYQM